MDFIKNIFKSQLFRLSSLNTLSILVRVAGGLVGSKMIALFIGPAGMAVTGNLRSMMTSLDAFCTLGMQNGIIKYTAENDKDAGKLNKVLATTFITILTTLGVVMLILFIPAGYWSIKVFGSIDYTWAIRTLAVTLPLYAGNLVFMAILNGLGNFKRVIYLNIWGNIAGVASTSVLIWQLGLTGALIGLIAYPSILFFFSVYQIHRLFPGFTFVKKRYFDKSILKGLLSYSVMMLLSAVLGSVVYIGIRNFIIERYSADDAGFYEAVNRIAGFYMMFASTMLTVYFLPKLSAATNNDDTKGVIRSYYKIMIPVFAGGLTLVYFLRIVIIKVLFAKDFLPMETLFLWQLTGDFFKVCSLILGFEFFAKKMTKAYIVSEVLSFTILYTASHLLIPQYGAEGAVMAHAITYACYFLVLAVYFRKKII